MKPIILLISLGIISSTLANGISAQQYSENNHADVSFDVSMPIDSTGYTLHGNNLLGGKIQFSDRGTYLNPLLASETGSLQLPVVTNLEGDPLIKTNVSYNAIKFINPNGINNLFIKVGMGSRTQIVSGLDPSVLKNGTYTWQAPIFSIGNESNSVDNKSNSHQVMQVGSIHGGPASSNAMYTQDFYLYSKSNGSTSITNHPIRTSRANEILSKPYTSIYTCKADGLWGAGGADPYRTITGKCQGQSMTFPAGPNLDYETGTFTLPTVHTPWNASQTDHCIFPGNKKHSDCVNASIGINLHYVAQKIRVPLDEHVTIFAESGTAYRAIKPTNLRYICKSNVYLKNILPQSDCLKKSYLPGGASYTYFAVGYEYKANDGTIYSAKYINLPGQENGNRLAWLDASSTYIYALSSSSNRVDTNTTNPLIEALDIIQKTQPAVYDVLGNNFFIDILKKNGLYAQYVLLKKDKTK